MFLWSIDTARQDNKLFEAWEQEMTTVSSLGTNELSMVDLASMLTCVTYMCRIASIGVAATEMLCESVELVATKR